VLEPALTGLESGCRSVPVSRFLDRLDRAAAAAGAQDLFSADGTLPWIEPKNRPDSPPEESLARDAGHFPLPASPAFPLQLGSASCIPWHRLCLSLQLLL